MRSYCKHFLCNRGLAKHVPDSELQLSGWYYNHHRVTPLCHDQAYQIAVMTTWLRNQRRIPSCCGMKQQLLWLFLARTPLVWCLMAKFLPLSSSWRKGQEFPQKSFCCSFLGATTRDGAIWQFITWEIFCVGLPWDHPLVLAAVVLLPRLQNSWHSH